MKMHEIIRQRRQTLGLTQEQLAVKLGVSAPAVNKWEKAASFPDITLLPPLARALGVDLNTLLSFQEDLTEDDIGTFLNQLYETAQNQGTSAAFQLAQEKLRQFPNSDLLAYQLANLLEGIRVLYSGDTEDDGAQEALIGELYERSAQSADPEIREWAVYTLAGRCIAQGDLDRAEQLLNQLSDTHRDKRSCLAALRRKQGRTEEAWVLLEQELFNQSHSIQSTLLSLIDMALAESDRPSAQVFSETAQRVGDVMDLSDYAVLSAPFQLAVAEQDAPVALALLGRLLRSLTIPWDLSTSPLYRHLPTKEATRESQLSLLGPILDQVESDPDCAFLRDLPEYSALVEKYRTIAEKA